MMKTIKNIFKSKITLAVLACLLLVGVFAGISTMAADGEPVFTVVEKNINHDQNASVYYKVKVDGVDANFVATNYGKFIMKFWNAPQTDVTAAAGYTATVDRYDGNYIYFESIGVAPKDMTTPFYSVVCYVDSDGNESCYSDTCRYSVFEYLCEANRKEDKTAEQERLYAAMENYITYAQKYLGYTDATTPDQIGYVVVQNGYFILGDDPSKTKLTSAAVPVTKQNYTVYFDFEGMPYRAETGYTYTKLGNRVSTISNGVTATDPDRTFVISKMVDVNVPAIPNTQIVALRPRNYNMTGDDRGGRGNWEFSADGTYSRLYRDGSIALVVKESFDNSTGEGGTYWVTERYDSITQQADGNNDYHIWGIAADPYDANGNPFSHWALEDGTFYSDDISIVFNELDIVHSKDPASPSTYDFPAHPVYAETADDYNYADTFTVGGSNAANVVTAVEGNKGFSIDATGKTVSGGTAATARATLDSTTVIDRFLFVANLTIDKHADHDTTTDDKRLLYGLNTGTAYNEISFYFGANRAFELLLYPVNDCSRVQITQRGASGQNLVYNGNYDASGIYFGDESEIAVYTEVINDGNGQCTLERFHLYINGIYAGFSTIHSPADRAFTYTGALNISIWSNGANKSKITYNEFKYYGFEAEQ